LSWLPVKLFTNIFKYPAGFSGSQGKYPLGLQVDPGGKLRNNLEKVNWIEFLQLEIWNDYGFRMVALPGR
jgi:hypothetical protein